MTDPPIDAVYFFRHSEYSDVELRYSLRSINSHMPWIRKVWIFGDRPRFLSDDRSVIEHVPHEYMARVGDYRTPVTNFFLMFFLTAQIPGLSNRFLWFCDDFIVLDSVSPQVGTRDRAVENLDNVKDRGTGLWKDCLWKTYDLLQRLGCPRWNFETHAPTFYTKQRILEAWCDFQDYVTEDRWFGMLGPTAILNHACLHEGFEPIERHVEGLWVGFHGDEPTRSDVEQQCTGKAFLNFDDQAFGDGLDSFLSERFSVMSHFEQPERKATFPVKSPKDDDGVQPSHEFPKVILKSRDAIPDWLNERGLTGQAAFIGVGDGLIVERFLKRWRGRRIYCIDDWTEALDDSKHIDRYNVPQWQVEHRYREALRRLSCFGDRCRIIRAPWHLASRQLAEERFDYIYLNDRHYHESVQAQLNTWNHHLTQFGVIAGNNYLDGSLPSGYFEVKRAVDSWSQAAGRPVVSTGEHIWRSWIMLPCEK